MVMRYAHPTEEHQFNAMRKIEAYRNASTGVRRLLCRLLAGERLKRGKDKHYQTAMPSC
jgi:hypothetical protein